MLRNHHCNLDSLEGEAVIDTAKGVAESSVDWCSKCDPPNPPKEVMDASNAVAAGDV